MRKGAYYSEWDPFAAQWLRNLIAENLIAPGDVDERSIAEVQADDLDGFSQCHFFAGIGGWSRALRLSGWPDDRPVWTGSCPCQPISVAGKRKGDRDHRHLWPEFRRLIAERRPATVFGEQVTGAPDWLRLVRGDLEAMEYAVGAYPIEAASAGADHFRDRYWFVADDGRAAGQQVAAGALGDEAPHGRTGWDGREQNGNHGCAGDGEGGQRCRVADHDGEQPGEGLQRGGQFGGASGDPQDCPWPLADGDGERSQIQVGQSRDIGTERQAAAGSDLRPVVDDPRVGWGEGWTESEFRGRGFTASVASIGDRQYVECPDGKWRRLPPPRVRWLGNGISARVAKLRALGNAIDPRPAAQFIGAYMDMSPQRTNGQSE